MRCCARSGGVLVDSRSVGGWAHEFLLLLCPGWGGTAVSLVVRRPRVLCQVCHVMDVCSYVGTVDHDQRIQHPFK